MCAPTSDKVHKKFGRKEYEGKIILIENEHGTDQVCVFDCVCVSVRECT